MNAAAAERLAFWQRFRAQYPGVAIGEEYAAALRERELELSARSVAQSSDAYVRELEARVARAEAQANQPADYYGAASQFTPELYEALNETIWDVVSNHPYTGVPEPTTLAMLVLGGLAVLRRKRRT